jgi:lipopolysaccharide transport system ATP-binding protein
MINKSFVTSAELSGLEAVKAHYLLLHQNLRGFDQFLDGVIEFSGLGEFINLPIKTYSEGMASRLLFSFLTATSHECLVIDEGFGAGDSMFYERAEARLKLFIEASGTLILASHSDHLLQQFCTRGLVFSHGEIVYDGALSSALEYYHHA